MLKFSNILAWLVGGLFLLSLCFRAFVYPHMYIAPGDPYGISDVIELFLGLLFITLIAVAGLTSLFLLVRGRVGERKSGVFLIAFCVALLVAMGPARELALSVW
ncbi:hypothetical protein [Zooshikella ganghwensis]|uniref:hypothetical protein n=1 Tax=Zooshikella ganghwensis TaxID=202772 RepID=UPI001BAEE1DA|nr:hypothetical protein [Zooshikella ganghwensis]